MVHEKVTNLPVALRNLRSEFSRDDGGAGRSTGATWTYRSKLGAKQWVWIRNTRGSVIVQPARGDSLEVSSVKTYRSSDPASVRLVAVPYDGGIAICAVWDSDSGCAPGHGDIEMRSRRHNDVAVDFTVRLPRGASLGATTMVGDVHVAGAQGPLVIHTMSGDVDVATAKGPVKVESMNGDVRVRMEAFGDTGGGSPRTIKGSPAPRAPTPPGPGGGAEKGDGPITPRLPA